MTNMNSEVEVNMQVPTSSAKFNTDGRTDERNEEPTYLCDQVTLVDAGEEDDFASIGSVIEAGLWPTGERHPVIRRGPRTEIPYFVRMAVLYRDHFTCILCPPDTKGTAKHLDHIKPWSAGGSDATSNLRVLCAEHNLERSNKITPDERPAVPATWWCSRCYTSAADWDYRQGVPACPTHFAWTGYTNTSVCRVQRAYLTELASTDELPTWHMRPPVEFASVAAYCAHCNLPGMTDVTL